MNEWNGREMICAGGTDLHESWKCSFYQYWHKSEWERKSIKVWGTGNGKHSKTTLVQTHHFLFYPSFISQRKSMERFPLQKGSGNKKWAKKFPNKRRVERFTCGANGTIFRDSVLSLLPQFLFFSQWRNAPNTSNTHRSSSELWLGSELECKEERKKAALGVNRFFVTLTTFSPSS